MYLANSFSLAFGCALKYARRAMPRFTVASTFLYVATSTFVNVDSTGPPRVIVIAIFATVFVFDVPSSSNTASSNSP